MTLRIFIGIELPQPIKESLFSISSSLKESIIGARWVAKDNIHLTLKFLGPTPEEHVDRIEAALRASTQTFRRFTFSLGDIGAFPSLKRARVLWVGIDQGSDELSRLSALVEEVLEPFGFKREHKPFTPHVTLSRLNPPKPVINAAEMLSAASVKGQTVNIDGLTIFQSRLKPTGAEYIGLRFIPLQN